jgi:hypothetical protein
MTLEPVSSYSFSRTLWVKIVPSFLLAIAVLVALFFFGEKYFSDTNQEIPEIKEEISQETLVGEGSENDNTALAENPTNTPENISEKTEDKSSKEALTENTPPAADLNTGNSSVNTDKIILNSAHEKRDYSLCLNIKSALLQKQCLEEKESYISKTASSAEECKSIGDTEKKYTCLRRFLTEEDFSAFAEDPFQCTEKNWKLDSDEEFCFKMAISSAFSSGKTISCSDFSGEILDFCREKESNIIDSSFFEKAEETLNYEYCEKINKEVERKKCKDGILFTATWEQKNADLCLEIEDEDLKRKCVNEQGKRIDSFFYRKAKLEKNNLLCIKISEMDLQKKCIQFFQK